MFHRQYNLRSFRAYWFSPCLLRVKSFLYFLRCSYGVAFLSQVDLTTWTITIRVSPTIQNWLARGFIMLLTNPLYHFSNHLITSHTHISFFANIAVIDVTMHISVSSTNHSSLHLALPIRSTVEFPKQFIDRFPYYTSDIHPTHCAPSQ